jgi:hypothetical protein
VAREEAGGSLDTGNRAEMSFMGRWRDYTGVWTERPNWKVSVTNLSGTEGQTEQERSTKVQMKRRVVSFRPPLGDNCARLQWRSVIGQSHHLQPSQPGYCELEEGSVRRSWLMWAAPTAHVNCLGLL